MAEPARPRGELLRRRSTVVLGTLLAALAVFGCSAATWVTVTARTALEPVTVDVAGSEAAPAVTALGLVAAAGALTLAISGRVLRSVVASVVVLAGLGALAAAAAVLVDPAGAAQTAVGEATGMINAGGVEPSLTVWPWLAAAASAVVALCGLWALLAGRSWTVARRYQRPAQEQPARTAPGDDIDSWDALTEGRDPTA